MLRVLSCSDLGVREYVVAETLGCHRIRICVSTRYLRALQCSV